MKRALYLALFLAITAGLAGGMLSFVNDLTKDKIAAAALEKELVYLTEIFPGAEFKQNTAAVAGEQGIIDLFEADGQGVVYKVTSNGYGGEIVFLVGFDTDDKIVGIAVISQSETKGIGDVILSDGFRTLNAGKGGGEALDTSSGATISSNAINKGIQVAAKHLAGGELEVEAAPIDFGAKLALNSEELNRYEAEIVNKEADGENTVYEVKAQGYGLKDAEYPNPAYKENLFKITVKTDSKEIVAIEMLEFGDTENLGDKVDNTNYYNELVGKSAADEYDTVTGATKTSYSLLSAIKAVMEDE